MTNNCYILTQPPATRELQHAGRWTAYTTNHGPRWLLELSPSVRPEGLPELAQLQALSVTGAQARLAALGAQKTESP